MLIRNFIPTSILLSSLALVAASVPYLSIWHFVDHRRYGAFPEEDHVSLVYILGGNFMTRLLFMQHFKSVLNYSDSNFRLHFIVDYENKEDVNDLMTSWNVSNVEWFFHNLTNYEKKVKWIPNSHYSKYYGLTKLLIPEIMSDNVGKVMYVDIDIVFRSDIFYLWQKFRDFNNQQSIGMIENLSDWYLNKDGKKSVWTARGRGFNSGIIMFDLDKLREENFKEKWRSVANKYLKIHGKTTMSDQDIFNAYVHDYPNQIKTLPCEYNFQLGNLAKSEELCHETPLALHFNSQNKTVRKNYALYNAIRKEIDGIDGSDLRRRKRRSFDAMQKMEETYGMRNRNECSSYVPLQNFRILPNALGRLEKTAHLCLVTQFSIDRLHNFLENVKTWMHPISAAIYGNDEELSIIVDAIKALNRTDITIHMVFREPDHQIISQTYPINFLRNFAMNHSNCEHILMADVDFMIYGDDSSLQEQVMKMKEKDLLIIPAFETSDENITDVSKFPQTKEKVARGIFSGKVRIFREVIWPNAHNATNVAEWIIAEDTYTVEYGKNYEPYFVIRKSECPIYDQRFGGFGWNKVTHVLQLRMLSFKFNVSPSAFMIHQNHNVSDSLRRWRTDTQYQKCLHILKKQFVVETARSLGMDLK
ncbi:hypothetical protein CAEBREN_08278 [Caenorhabditis brenneri]|uniref:Uncharacterized protein n=1 Tax=Caenorhabditis brenneri TaxID=135651 RepID=G0MHK6_CAEBE|nr:hypothetical protein CAEBREN_08278 [Caenorhabditis brenneri]